MSSGYIEVPCRRVAALAGFTARRVPAHHRGKPGDKLGGQAASFFPPHELPGTEAAILPIDVRKSKKRAEKTQPGQFCVLGFPIRPI